MRVFLDANILFSAAKSDGAVRRLFELLIEAGHQCVADTYVIEEARRNLAIKAPAGLKVLNDLLSHCEVAEFRLPDRELEAAPLLPEKDLPVFAAAVRLRCDVLVTGDQAHFGNLYGRNIDGIAIHSPRSLAETALK